MSMTSSKRLDSDPGELPYWLALLRAPELGNRRFHQLLVQPDAPRTLFETSRADLKALGVGDALADYLTAPDWRAVEKDLQWLSQPGRRCLTFCDPAYPALLREIASPPPILLVQGNAAVLSQPQIAMVGSRNPSPIGEKIAFEMAVALANSGLWITSGLALGIDAASHRGALSTGERTIAVIGTGLDQAYPRRHRALMDQIADSGAVVSEFPLGTPPKAVNFPRRNRIISGLSAGTLVVEAALRSGSLITARLAAEQGREVFAIPGSIHNPLARGCHSLIQQGAKLVETVTDILDELGPLGLSPPHAAEGPVRQDILDPPSRELLKYVACEPTSVDTLVAATGFSAELTLSLLVMLELNGYVASAAGGCYCRIT